MNVYQYNYKIIDKNNLYYVLSPTYNNYYS